MTPCLRVTTGEIDPWRELSVVGACTVDGEKVHDVLIEDAAHCADMMSSGVDDRASLKSGRKVTQRNVLFRTEHKSNIEFLKKGLRKT